MRPWQRLFDDAEVGLAFYGSIIYVAVVSALGAEEEAPVAAIGAVVASASVLYVAHVFASLVPRVARAGRVRRGDVAEGLRHDLPLLVTVVVPTVPLVLAASSLVATPAAYRLSVRLTMAMLFVLAVTLSRRGGLAWNRSVAAGGLIVAVTAGISWLETHVH